MSVSAKTHTHTHTNTLSRPTLPVMADQTLSVLSSEPLTIRSPLNWRQVITWSSWPFSTCHKGRFQSRQLHVYTPNTGWVCVHVCVCVRVVERVPWGPACLLSSSCSRCGAAWCRPISTDWRPRPASHTSCDETTHTPIYLERERGMGGTLRKTQLQYLIDCQSTEN